ncbi:MAG: hypothetical protein GWN61_26540 [candidate division Zixibacteria bacterium]|nr:hypothetical protein [candidate division Zixibacteria bacterium]NIU17494.1 hypothetical protein [candidate division Zixibacteria bacterium]NIV09633.1 hypothetical protein [candidate division Zixibacteria bacterium]NIW50510.1 hypothetical protein [Gammaproteobacteria bacterium]
MDAFDQFRYTPLSIADRLDQTEWKKYLTHINTEYPDLSDYVIYIAGPEKMVETACSFFTSRGLDEDYLFSENMPD